MHYYQKYRKKIKRKSNLLAFSFAVPILLLAVTLLPLKWRLVHSILGPSIASKHAILPAKATEETGFPIASDATTQSNVAIHNGHDYQIPAAVNGKVPVISHIQTNENVAFLTIDDGIVTDPSDAAVMDEAKVKATFFLVHRFIAAHRDYFKELASSTGSDIENHSYDHFLMTNLTYDQQKTDICRNADAFKQWFGKRPLLFRPSGGAYNDDTLRAAYDCGMKALVMWNAAINNGRIRYQSGNSLKPGDIVLMHFRSTFSEDLNAFAKAARNAGLQPALLNDWL